MNDNANANEAKSSPKSEKIIKIVGGIAGIVILTLQGVNLNELGVVSDEGRQRAMALKGIEQSIDQNSKILESLEHSIKQNSDILKNGETMLDHDSRSLENQQKILEVLQARISPSPVSK